jgi:site-specific DNA recombinase
MENAISYVRISKKDQSNFSIEGQQEFNKNHAAKMGWSIIATFIDDGVSAKNFDRPDWIKLEDFIKEHYKIVSYLIVCKYDRISRNASEGLDKINKIEKKYGIVIVSVFEQFFIDKTSPFFFKMRADMMVQAEFELHVIKDRTKMGIHSALSSGRIVNKAPFGYVNKRDSSNKPIIVPVQEHKNAIIKMFECWAAGGNLVAVKSIAKNFGIKLNGNSSIVNLLNNPIYAGLVRVPAFKFEKEKIIKGIHEPMISEVLFNRAQERSGKNVHRLILNDEVPLRGLMRCFCGAKFTAGKSKGRNKYYWYYRCNDHKNINVSATNVHNQLELIIKGLSLDDVALNYLRTSAFNQMQELLAERKKNAVLLKNKMETTFKKIEDLESKYLNNQVNIGTYERWYSKYNIEYNSLRNENDKLSETDSKLWDLFSGNLYKLGNLWLVFESADLLTKHELLNEWFNFNLQYVNGNFRTNYIHPLFTANMLILKQKGLIDIVDNNQLTLDVVDSSENRSSVEPFNIFKIIAKIKIA